MSEAWRELSDREVRALIPFTLQCADLDTKAVRQVRLAWREMVTRAFFAFVTELERVPDEREGELLARAIVAHINAVVIPILGGQGNCHATLQ